MTATPFIGRRIAAAFPRPADIGRFIQHLRYPTRASALRGFADGLVVSYTLKTKGVRSLLSLQRCTAGHVDAERAISVSAAVDAGFALLPVSPTCLRRSVTLLRELNRLGDGARLHIGVRSSASGIEAHAWVQVADVVVNDDHAHIDTYVELAAGELERMMPDMR